MHVRNRNQFHELSQDGRPALAYVALDVDLLLCECRLDEKECQNGNKTVFHFGDPRCFAARCANHRRPSERTTSISLHYDL